MNENGAAADGSGGADRTWSLPGRPPADPNEAGPLLPNQRPSGGQGSGGERGSAGPDAPSAWHAPESSANEPSAHAAAAGATGPAHRAGPARSELSGTLLGNRYRLIARLGQGGMGTVWRAHDEVIGRDVAIKEPRVPQHIPEEERGLMLARLEREARAAAQIEHSSVVGIYDVVAVDGQPWVVMELVRGQSLADVLAEGTLAPEEAARIGLAIVGALTAAHSQKMLHRDVKPSNVMLGPSGRVVLTDFGIAHIEGETSLTQTGAVVGSPEYTAPERVLGQIPGPPSDFFSLGVLLYTALEGFSPYRRQQAATTFQAVLHAEPQRPLRAGALTDLVLRLLHKEPHARPTGDEIVTALEGVAGRPSTLEGLEQNASSPSPGARGETGTDQLRGAPDRAEDGAEDLTRNIGRGGRGGQTADEAGRSGQTAGGAGQVGDSAASGARAETAPSAGSRRGGRRGALLVHPVVTAVAASLVTGAVVSAAMWPSDDEQDGAGGGKQPAQSGSKLPKGWKKHREIGASVATPAGYTVEHRPYGDDGPNPVDTGDDNHVAYRQNKGQVHRQLLVIRGLDAEKQEPDGPPGLRASYWHNVYLANESFSKQQVTLSDAKVNGEKAKVLTLTYDPGGGELWRKKELFYNHDGEMWKLVVDWKVDSVEDTTSDHFFNRAVNTFDPGGESGNA